MCPYPSVARSARTSSQRRSSVSSRRQDSRLAPSERRRMPNNEKCRCVFVFGRAFTIFRCRDVARSAPAWYLVVKIHRDSWLFLFSHRKIMVSHVPSTYLRRVFCSADIAITPQPTVVQYRTWYSTAIQQYEQLSYSIYLFCICEIVYRPHRLLVRFVLGQTWRGHRARLYI